MSESGFQEITIQLSPTDCNDTTTDMEMSNSPVSSVTQSSTLVVSSTSGSSTTTWPIVVSGPAASGSLAAAGAAGFSVLTAADPSLIMFLNQCGHFGFLPTAADPASLLLSDVSRVGLVQKETIRLLNATLYPPNPIAPAPHVRVRPPGCRTIFVGGLPELCTEEILRELFLRCGEIQSIRMSKKNFAHIRFICSEGVDKALYFSGYRIRLEDRTEKEYSGRLHVDYAQARDDQHEFEMQQRIALREQRERERSSSPSASAVRYSEHEATNLLEKLKNADGFALASSTLGSWLDKGNCNKKTSTHFYSLIAAVNAHVRRLLQDKQQFDAEMVTFKEKHNQRLQNIASQFGQIEKVFRSARKQKNWDHFSKGQRKNLDAWLKQAEDLRKAHESHMLKNREEEEMETSDDDDADSLPTKNVDQGHVDEQSSERAAKRQKFDPSEFYQRQAAELRAENNCLKARLILTENFTEESDKNDSDVIGEHKTKLAEIEAKLEAATKTIAERDNHIAKLEKEIDGGVVSTSTVNCNSNLDSRDAQLISILSNFLHVHPCGATIDYLWSYLRQMMDSIKSSEIETVLESYPSVFRRKECGVGASYERKWYFVGFESRKNCQ